MFRVKLSLRGARLSVNKPSAKKHLYHNDIPFSVDTWSPLANRTSGRGALSNESGRFEPHQTSPFDDGWGGLEEDLPKLETEILKETPKTALTYNTSPDISFDRTVNPYRGCEHGCIYCFGRPAHAYSGLSPGLDFETKIFVKPGIVELLEKELSRARYSPRTIVLGGDTDIYQPIEKKLKITRRLIELMARAKHPFGFVTKSALVLRDLDLLASLAEQDLVRAAVSLTSLDNKLSRRMEPRAAAPHRRLATIRALSAAGIPVTVMTAPIVPAINDMEIERLLAAASDAGATRAGYVLLRLPREISHLFQEWLAANYPDRAEKVMTQMRAMRGGKDYQSEFVLRQTGQGEYARLIAQRFKKAAKRFNLNKPALNLRTDLFCPPRPIKSNQRDLFET